MIRPLPLFALLLLPLLCLHALAEKHVFTDEQRAWWAVQPLAKPEPPKAGGDWARNAIDRFIARGHETAGVTPAPEAERLALLRRATFDLHGLPPTRARIDAFLADERPDAFERVVDELLASPRYGEHWAQHWLDVVRFSESDGYRADFFRPEAYRYRDWVIDALNEDMPYDIFVRAQLAGDEAKESGGSDDLIATGFLRHGVYEYNQRDARGHWQLILDEVTRTTGEAFLGLGIGCAQCHDHKFDPILQRDYYALQAYFSTMAWPTDRVLADQAERHRFAAAMADWEEATAAIRFELAELVGAAREKKARDQVEQFPPDIQAMYDKPAAERSPFEAQMAALVQRQVDDQLKSFNGASVLKKDKEKLKRYEELADELKVYVAMKPASLPRGFVATDIAAEAVPTRLNVRGTERDIAPGVLAILDMPVAGASSDGRTTGRRSALASWVTRDDNPLSTRVIVNRLWQHHFGSGLVATPNDFGTLGEPPSHPELLDWLARDLVSGEWKLKRLHRLMMTSSTYRQAASEDDAEGLLVGVPARRLSAEQLRDAMLAASGELQTVTVGGKSVSGSSTRRSVYVQRKRNTPDEVLAAFDAPTGFESAPTRQNTATPTQSLLLSNHHWPLKRARVFATNLLKQHPIGDGEGSGLEMNAALVDAAYLRAYGRLPNERERTAALDFVATTARAIKAEPPPPKPKSGTFLPVADDFAKVKGYGLDSHALQLGSKNPSGAAQVLSDWDDRSFTIQAVTQLDRVHDSAQVNTLAARWAGRKSGKAGWSFGVTSARSGYQPRKLILQLSGASKVGEPATGAGATVPLSYEVVDSNLEIPLGVPVYLAVVLRAEKATFYAKDLSTPDAPLMVNVVQHGIVGAIQDPTVPFLLGTREERGHAYDGLLARLKITANQLATEDLLPFAAGDEADASSVVVDWSFDERAGTPAEGGAWFGGSASKPPSDQAVRLDALTDFCHALLMSNEFLYVD